MRDPFDELTADHRIIEKVLGALEQAAHRDMPAGFYERALDFLEQFADAYHHGKEEQRLFQYLEKRGLPRDYGPIGVMMMEHDSGRRHVGAMRQYLRDNDLQALRKESLAYASMLRDHIEREDTVLFAMGRAMLTRDEIGEIGESFWAIPVPEPGYEHWADVAEALASEAGVAV
jgi:hemerythrin-like domain-containing protein